MEQILAFVLGVSAVAFVWVAMVTFRTSNRVTKQEKELIDKDNWVLKNDEIVNRRIDQETDRVNNLYNDSIRYTDSRVDKLEAKLTSINNDGCEPVKKKKLIKG
jgi:Na+-transporting NADH:ubiquinone oxidoreductase subunit NqrC